MRLVVAEDSLLVREGLVRLLDGLGHEVAGTAVRAEQVLPVVARCRPDVTVLDVRLPPTCTDEGIRLASALRARHPALGLLVLSQQVEPAIADVLLDRAGGRVGYLLKDRVFDATTLDAALCRLAGGETVVDEDLVERLIARPRAGDPLAALTPRERDVLALMAQGLSDLGIAGKMSVSLTTVGTHVRGVYRKLSLPARPADNRRVGAVLAYLRQH